MALKIRWTPEADAQFDNVIEFLVEQWSDREIKAFTKALDGLLLRISEHPYSSPSATGKEELRKGKIDNNNYIIYKVDKTLRDIEIITIRGSKQKPLI